MKLEDLLKTQGWTDADIAAQATILQDPKLRGAIETSYGVIQEDLQRFKVENDGWAKWHEEHGKPTLALYEKDRADALAEAASLRERLRLAEESGFAPRREQSAPAAPADLAEPAFDPKKYNLVTQKDVQQFADMEGRAIAMAADLAEEYRVLTGRSLVEYEAEIEGRRMRGMSALRAEAIKHGKPLDEYVGAKFDFAAKRQAIADEQRKKAEDAIRADERSKVIGQYGDPNTRPMMPSREPFFPASRDKNSAQPWERPAQERRAERLQRAMQTQMQSLQ